MKAYGPRAIVPMVAPAKNVNAVTSICCLTGAHHNLTFKSGQRTALRSLHGNKKRRRKGSSAELLVSGLRIPATRSHWQSHFGKRSLKSPTSARLRMVRKRNWSSSTNTLRAPKFCHRVEAIVEKLSDMRADLDREKKAMTRAGWKTCVIDECDPQKGPKEKPGQKVGELGPVRALPVVTSLALGRLAADFLRFSTVNWWEPEERTNGRLGGCGGSLRRKRLSG